MLEREFESVTFSRATQPKKASASIFLTDAGRMISSRAMQPLNVFAAIAVIAELLSVMVVSFVAFSKAPVAIVFTELGILIVLMLVFLKAPARMISSVEGNMMLSSEAPAALLNRSVSSTSTPSGIVNEVTSMILPSSSNRFLYSKAVSETTIRFFDVYHGVS